MHSLVLSKEQMRKVRHFLSQKDINFPTTNEILPIRKSMRPPTYPVVVENEGRGVCYTELVQNTVSSVLKIVKDISPNEPLNDLKMCLKDGGDGAGTMPALKSKQAVSDGDEEDGDHIFQYGIIPLKLTSGDNIIWQNKVPNSARSLRPIYLIREVEDDKNLLNFVIKETDQARNDLNSHGVKIGINVNGTDLTEFHVACKVKDTMKDLKLELTIYCTNQK